MGLKGYFWRAPRRPNSLYRKDLQTIKINPRNVRVMLDVPSGIWYNTYMKMTRSHFSTLADCCAEIIGNVAITDEDAQSIVNSFVHVCESSNPLFNKAKFIERVGVEAPEHYSNLAEAASSAFSEYFIFLDAMCQDKYFQQMHEAMQFLCLDLLKRFPEITETDAKEIVNEWVWGVKV